MRAFLKAGPAAPPPVKRRILIVDDHNFFSACLRSLLDNEADLTVCDIMANSAELRERIARLKPDLLVIDLTLGSENGLEIGERLRAMEIRTPILFVSSLQAPAPAQLAAIGASSFIPKSRTPAKFLATLRAMLAPERPAAAGEPTNLALGHARSKA